LLDAVSIVQLSEKASHRRDAYDSLASHVVALLQGGYMAAPEVMLSPRIAMRRPRGGGGGAKDPSVRTPATV
jgi:hypothetical protein